VINIKTLKETKWVRYSFRTSISIAIGLFFTFIFGGSTMLGNWRHIFLYGIYGSVIGIGLWKGNSAVSAYVEQFIQWNKEPKRAFKYQLIISFAYTVLFIIIANSIWFPFIEKMKLVDFWSSRMAKSIFLLQFFITIMISAILYTKEFFQSWQQSIQNEEDLKRKAMSLQYESLKNQVNPHFLFNSLNVLSSLVYIDADRANEFIKKLSDVYRYVLDQKNKELVSFEEEMNFLKDFVYLHQIRFGDNLKVDFKLNGHTDKSLIPMSMQLLMENVIKHNVITKSKPLQVEVIQHKDVLEMRNVLQKKTSVVYSAKIGLENLNEQYKYLTGKSCEVDKTDTHFSVKVPIINMNNKDANTNN